MLEHGTFSHVEAIINGLEKWDQIVQEQPGFTRRTVISLRPQPNSTALRGGTGGRSNNIPGSLEFGEKLKRSYEGTTWAFYACQMHCKSSPVRTLPLVVILSADMAAFQACATAKGGPASATSSALPKMA